MQKGVQYQDSDQEDADLKHEREVEFDLELDQVKSLLHQYLMTLWLLVAAGDRSEKKAQ